MLNLIIRRRLRLWLVLTGMFLVGFAIAYVKRSIVDVGSLQIRLDIRAKQNYYKFHGSTEERMKYNRLKSIFEAGEWKSEFVSSYHKPYSANCSAILSGDKLAIKEGTLLTKDRGAIQMPSDHELDGWTSDCDRYRRRRKYPTKPWSDEEKSYPIAYILSVVKQGPQIERLFRAIYAPQNIYCFHVAKQASRELRITIKNLTNCFSNAFVASKQESVKYSRLKADLSCVSDLMSHQWEYVINLDNYDFPLKTNREIVWQLKALKGKNDIPGVYPEQTDYFVGMTRNHYEAIAGKLRKTLKRKPPPPHSALIYLGTSYFAAKREFIKYVLNNQTAIDLLEYLSDSSNPSRHYWITVNRYPGVPGGFPYSTWASSIRFINLTNSIQSPLCVGKWLDMSCIVGTGFVPHLSTTYQLFVNGIHYDYDPVALQCLEDLLDYRTKNPDSLWDFVSEYPVTNLFEVSSDRKPDYLKQIKRTLHK